MKYCTNCGSPLAEGAKFCTNCGTQVVAPASRPTQPQPTQPAPVQAPAPVPAAKTPGTPSVAPVIKDLFAGATPGEMVLSSWTVAAPVRKVVAAAKNVIAEPGRKRRGGFGRFVLRLLIIIVVLLILPTVLEYIGLENISEQIRTFFDGLLNRIIG